MEVHGGSAFYFMQETAAKRIWVAHHGCNMWNRFCSSRWSRRRHGAHCTQIGFSSFWHWFVF